MNGVTYIQCEDYLFPNLILEDQIDPIGEAEHILGIYGRMRRAYLKEYRTILYNTLLLNGKLHDHLFEIDQSANELFNQIMASLEQQNPPPDKAADSLGWAAHMNGLWKQANETILHNVIYN